MNHSRRNFITTLLGSLIAAPIVAKVVEAKPKLRIRWENQVAWNPNAAQKKFFEAPLDTKYGIYGGRGGKSVAERMIELHMREAMVQMQHDMDMALIMGGK